MLEGCKGDVVSFFTSSVHVLTCSSSCNQRSDSPPAVIDYAGCLRSKSSVPKFRKHVDQPLIAIVELLHTTLQLARLVNNDTVV